MSWGEEAALQLVTVLVTAHGEGTVDGQSVDKGAGTRLAFRDKLGSRQDTSDRGISSLRIVETKPGVMICDRGEGVRSTRDLRVWVDKVMGLWQTNTQKR